VRQVISICILALVATFTASCARSPAPSRNETTAMHAMVVATSGTGAAEVGLAALRRGGTAMDAVLTTAMLQPCLAAGSYVSYAGILALVYFDAASNEVYSLDAGYNTVRGEKYPRTIPGPSVATQVEKGLLSAISYEPSGRTALVPGFLAGVEAGHARFGKLAFADIVEPAVRCADNGFEYTQSLSDSVRTRDAVLDRLAETKAVFRKADGERYAVGEIFRQPELANTLRAVVKQGVREHIYEGDWAKAFVDAVRRDGGYMTLEDLASYQPTWSDPVHGKFNGYDVYAFGRPAHFGAALIESLNLATSARLTQMPSYQRSPQTLFHLMQIGKIAMIYDPKHEARVSRALGMDFSPASRLQQHTADALWRQMQSRGFPEISAPSHKTNAHTDVVVAVDARGNVAALVHSINTVNFGATGIFVHGISVPDSASFQQWEIAQLLPGARLPATIAPGIALKNGKPVLGFGAAGHGWYMRTLAALVSVLGRDMTPQQAINAPSMGAFDFSKAAAGEVTGTVAVDDFDDAYLQELRDLGQSVKEDDAARGYWIGVSIDERSGTLHGGALREHDSSGMAVGY
jgi:gamma-glutamyltranspeptidase / glutathione hydrolase